MRTLRIALAALLLAGAASAQETAGDGTLTASHILDWERVSGPAIPMAPSSSTPAATWTRRRTAGPPSSGS